MRGTNSNHQMHMMQSSGSPPLARDKFTISCCTIQTVGITPACAGQISIKNCGKESIPDHPRLRGTNNSTRPTTNSRRGSPPLARDKWLGGVLSGYHCGITPACAGQMSVLSITTIRHRDHPRLRGTNLEHFARLRTSMGSPPLARDK